MELTKEAWLSTLCSKQEGAERVLENFEFVFKVLPPGRGDAILDVGCGRGDLSVYLQARVPGLHVTLCDIYKNKELFLPDNFVLGSMTELPFPNESFDKIYCNHVIAHIKDQNKAISEAMRVLRKGGSMFVYTPNRNYVAALRLAASLRLVPPVKYDPTALHLLSKKQLERLLGVKAEYHRNAPRNLPIQLLREKLVAVVRKSA